MELLHHHVTHNISKNDENSENISWDVPLSLSADISDGNEGLTDFIFNDSTDVSNKTPTGDLFNDHKSILPLPNFDNLNENEYTREHSSFELPDLEEPFVDVNLRVPIERDNVNSVLGTYWNDSVEPSGALLMKSITKNESYLSENDELRLVNFEIDVENMPTENALINKITSPVKQELNLKVQIERLKRGESELYVTPDSPKTYELREDEVEKRNKRLQQNRKSANKSRLKEQMRLQQIQEKLESAKATQKELQKEVGHLQAERTRLRQEFDKHSRACKKLQLEAHRHHILRW